MTKGTLFQSNTRKDDLNKRHGSQSQGRRQSVKRAKAGTRPHYDKCGMNPLYLVLALFVVIAMMAAYGHKSLRRLQDEVSVLHSRVALLTAAVAPSREVAPAKHGLN